MFLQCPLPLLNALVKFFHCQLVGLSQMTERCSLSHKFPAFPNDPFTMVFKRRLSMCQTKQSTLPKYLKSPFFSFQLHSKMYCLTSHLMRLKTMNRTFVGLRDCPRQKKLMRLSGQLKLQFLTTRKTRINPIPILIKNYLRRT